MARAEKKSAPCDDIWDRHVTTMYACASARVYMCVRVCMCARVYVIKETSTLLRIFANSLITHTLYTHILSLISAMWDYVFAF